MSRRELFARLQRWVDLLGLKADAEDVLTATVVVGSVVASAGIVVCGVTLLALWRTP